jgi:hypothetical protein
MQSFSIKYLTLTMNYPFLIEYPTKLLKGKNVYHELYGLEIVQYQFFFPNFPTEF